MTTNNPRVYTTFKPNEYNDLSLLEKKRHLPISTLVKQLAMEALELQEDLYLSKIADDRYKKEHGQGISIDEWKV